MTSVKVSQQNANGKITQQIGEDKHDKVEDEKRKKLVSGKWTKADESDI